MKDVLIRNGDLVPGRGGVEEVRGLARLRQSLTHALLEPYGVDRFNPRWGSTLHRMIGETSTQLLHARAEAEVGRIVKNYLYVQRLQAERRAQTYNRSFIDGDELVAGVRFGGMEATMDKLYITLNIATPTNKSLSIRLSNEAR